MPYDTETSLCDGVCLEKRCVIYYLLCILLEYY